MSRPLGYSPPVPADTGASDEVDELVQALHESGLLRVIAGGARAYPELLGTLMKAVDADTSARRSALAGGLRDLDPEESAKVAEGIRRARTDAVAAAAGMPEGPGALQRIKRPRHAAGDLRGAGGLAALGGSLPR